ncbi:MAG: hypothetical protein OXE46_15955, partial [Chloroflexi bacterium]|nr:hypothetical protein [Chloroflexota bacterium]
RGAGEDVAVTGERIAVTKKSGGVEGGEVLQRDLSRADAPPEIAAVELDDSGAVSVAAYDKAISPAGAAVDADDAGVRVA